MSRAVLALSSQKSGLSSSTLALSSACRRTCELRYLFSGSAHSTQKGAEAVADIEVDAEALRVLEDDQVGGLAKDGGKIDYDKLIDKFGCQRLDSSLIDRVQRLTGRPPHVFLRRSVFFAHRDFGDVLDAYERGDKFYLYTGRGPSSESLHLGHLIPFMFTKYLQDAFKVPLVIQLTDDEKCIWKNLTVEESMRLARENINKYAFSGRQDSIENHRKYGANLEVDIPIKYLGFFSESDDEPEHIRKEYGAGRMLTGEVKKHLVEVLTELVERHRRAPAAVTDEMVDAFMAVRPLPSMFA